MCHFFMAIPFNLPSDEETEENYRRMDQLLADLYSILRQILLRPWLQQPLARDSRPSGPQDEAAGGTDPPDENGDSVGQRILGLPDLVLSTLPSSNRSAPSSRTHAHSLPGPLVRRRRRRHSRCCHKLIKSAPPVQEVTRVDRPQDSWVLVGEELRKIAEDFRASYKKKKEPVKESEDTHKFELKSSCLFSLLVPATFGGSISIWSTTVILLVGWRILMRQR